MALSHVERGQTAVEAVLAAICNELAIPPEAIPEHVFIPLAHQVSLLCLALEHPSTEMLLCPTCGNTVVAPPAMIRRTP